MKLGVMSVYVDDQDKALRFYTDTLGFAKKLEFPYPDGKFKYLTVVSPEEPDGMQLSLAPTDNPAASAYQQALHKQGTPAAMFFVDDVEREYDRLSGQGVTFTTPPTKTPGSTIAILDDTCGNLIQLTHLSWG